MCTLLIGRDVTGPGEIVIGANRDEDPARPTDPPRVLVESPRIVGGRDRRSGGTWLALRAPRARAGAGALGAGEAPAATMVLNRPPRPGAPAARRSRGLLVLEVAAAADPLRAARAAQASGDFGPCTLVHASPDACWWLAIPGDAAPRHPGSFGEIPAGWHAITHAELDDDREPRTAWLVPRLRALGAPTVDEAFAGLASLLARHGDDGTSPAVCIHAGRMPTVSASLLLLARDRALYRHAEGRPCEHPFTDRGALLVPAAGGPRA